MKIQLQEALPINVNGEKIAIEAQFSFDASPNVDLAQVLQAAAQQLLGPSKAPQATQPASQDTQEETKEAPGIQWQRPDLHGKALASVHRVVDAIGRAGGRGLTVAEIQDKARISAVPAYKMLKADDDQGRYAARFLRTTKVGRSTVVDLTKEGRQLASLIRAGKVPG